MGVMMFAQHGERVIEAFEVHTRHGSCLMHVSTKRVLLENGRLGCIMVLGYAEMASCSLQSAERGKRGGRLGLYHHNGHSISVSARRASAAVDAINSALALYRAALTESGLKGTPAPR